MVAITQTDVRGYTDLLEGNPPSTGLPNIDERQMVFTFPADPKFLNADWFAWGTPATSIAGAIITVDDVGQAGGVDPTYIQSEEKPAATHGRYYQWIMARLGGTGTVANVDLQFTARIINAAGVLSDVIFSRNSVPNPGEVIVGPLWIPPGFGPIRITNVGVGGAGDTLQIQGVGQFVPRGLPAAIMNAPRTLETV